MRIVVCVALTLDQSGQVANIRELGRREKAAKISTVSGEEFVLSGIACTVRLEFEHPRRAVAFLKEMLEQPVFFEISVRNTY